MLFEYNFYCKNNNLNLNYIEACNNLLNKGIKEEMLFNSKLNDFNYDLYRQKYTKNSDNTWFEICCNFLKDYDNFNNVLNEKGVNYDELIINLQQ